jgi:hypothetical protein
MGFPRLRMPAGSLLFSLAACALAHAMCPVDVVAVKGHIDHSPSNARVRVQLIYPRNLGGDSAEAILADSDFSLSVEFITQSRRPLLVGTFREKCDRRPETVIVTLVGGDPPREYDRVSLKLAENFRKTDPSNYALKSEIVLKGLR